MRVKVLAVTLELGGIWVYEGKREEELPSEMMILGKFEGKGIGGYPRIGRNLGFVRVKEGKNYHRK